MVSRKSLNKSTEININSDDNYNGMFFNSVKDKENKDFNKASDLNKLENLKFNKKDKESMLSLSTKKESLVQSVYDTFGDDEMMLFRVSEFEVRLKDYQYQKFDKRIEDLNKEMEKIKDE